MAKTANYGTTLVVSYPAYQNKDAQEKVYYLTLIKQQGKCLDLASRWGKDLFFVYKEMVNVKVFPFTLETAVNNIERVLVKIFYEEKKDFASFIQRVKYLVNYTEPKDILDSLKDPTIKFDMLDQYLAIFGMAIIPGTNSFRGWGIADLDRVLIESKALSTIDDVDSNKTFEEKLFEKMPESMRDEAFPQYKQSKAFKFMPKDAKREFVLKNQELSNLKFKDLVTNATNVTQDDIGLLRIANGDVSHIRSKEVVDFFKENANDLEIARTSIKQFFKENNYSISALFKFITDMNMSKISATDESRKLTLASIAFYRYFGIKVFSTRTSGKFDFTFVKLSTIYDKLGDDVACQAPEIPNFKKSNSQYDVEEIKTQLKQLLTLEIDKIINTYTFYTMDMYFMFVNKNKAVINTFIFSYEKFMDVFRDVLEQLKSERGDFSCIYSSKNRVFINKNTKVPENEEIHEYSQKLNDSKEENKPSPEIAIPSKLEMEWLVTNEAQINSLVTQLKNTGYVSVQNAKDLAKSADSKFKIRISCKFEIVKE